MNKKITVKDLRDLKGKKKLVSILVKNVNEAKAAHKVGFEMLATGSPGKYVSLEDSIKGFNGILNGDYDDLPEQAFYMVGTIEEAVEKAKTM